MKKEIRSLEKNSYVKKVSEKTITYPDDFKDLFILKLNEGKTPRMIFE